MAADGRVTDNTFAGDRPLIGPANGVLGWKERKEIGGGLLRSAESEREDDFWGGFNFWVGFKKFPLKVKPTCVQIGDGKSISVSTGDRSMNLVSKSETTIIFGLC